MQNDVDFETLKTEAEKEIASATNMDSLLPIKGKWIGKDGIIAGLMGQIRTVANDQKKQYGASVNALKTHITEKIQEKISQIEDSRSAVEWVDLSLPGIRPKAGSLHPITRVIRQVSSIFEKMGFSVESGPEIETEFYNFEALNVPAHHPARDTQDTFFVTQDRVLRTQTSGIQIRTMQAASLPLRMIAPGKVFRVDHDATHSPVFHQIEGLMVDKDVHFGHLKYILRLMMRELFGQEREVRFRPSFFPFTEPSAEMDVSCFQCGGKGCKLCKHTGWIEVLGCGMVDPNVFLAVNIDPDVYSGWAFGIGVERIAMMQYGISDIRAFYENDVRFLSQFSFVI
ncbi:MAG: phenylalanine--tRNA ligase subunit alpha [Candidatus Cloacimonetes bacterium]|nr:phenylalanine--tRNA ligase subunit alpha [Candidatus Cloacimonadota bacterium]